MTDRISIYITLANTPTHRASLPRSLRSSDLQFVTCSNNASTLGKSQGYANPPEAHAFLNPTVLAKNSKDALTRPFAIALTGVIHWQPQQFLAIAPPVTEWKDGQNNKYPQTLLQKPDTYEVTKIRLNGF